MQVTNIGFNIPMKLCDIIPEDCMLMAPVEFTALITGYAESLEKEYSATVKVERAVLMDLIEKWLNNPENRKKLCLIKNIGE